MDNKKQLFYKVDDSSVLLINHDVLAIMGTHAQDLNCSNEQGGVLIGQYRGNHMIIVDCTIPQKEDVASRYKFERRSKQHKEIVLQGWRDSGKINTYIGEWHTHPEDFPSPSNIDTNNWKKGLPKNKKTILIIQGRKSLWVGSYLNGHISSLSLLDYD